LNAVRRWFDNWEIIWHLKQGCGKGIWVELHFGTPHTIAMANVASAYCAFGLVTGENEAIGKAGSLISFQATQWLPDGRPINHPFVRSAIQQAREGDARIFLVIPILNG